MAKVRDKEEFINQIRYLDFSLKNIKISNIEINEDEREITYNFICDNTISPELKEKIVEIASKNTPSAFLHVGANFTKIVSDCALINTYIYNYLKDNYPSISIFLKPTDILSIDNGNVVKYVLRLTKDGVEYVTKNKTIQKLSDYLSKKFCSDFSGAMEEKEQEETIDLLSDEVYESELQKIEYRTITVTDVVTIDDENMGNTALYIEDAREGEVTICGTVTDIKERMTKSEKPKPFFIIYLDDTTGKTSGLYFSRKSTYQKIKDITVGEDIICRGNIEFKDGKKSFKIDKINRCTIPKGFVKKEKFKKAVPMEYKTIFPQPVSIIKASSVFDSEKPLPQSLLQNTYVVFDLETTGIELMTNGITEIGAVKVKDGKMVESFTTLVKPDYPISAEITKITGITEEMVKDSPKISTVIPDFMKFIDGSIVVAHNADFDTGFIRRFAKAEDYEFKNKVIDTMHLARETVPQLKHVGLSNIAEHFNIVFNHHRALDDAMATAEAFIEMMKIKG